MIWLLPCLSFQVAASPNNSLCAVGIAYNAQIGGIRMLDGQVSDAVEARSLSYSPDHIDIYSRSVNGDWCDQLLTFVTRRWPPSLCIFHKQGDLDGLILDSVDFHLGIHPVFTFSMPSIPAQFTPRQVQGDHSRCSQPPVDTKQEGNVLQNLRRQ